MVNNAIFLFCTFSFIQATELCLLIFNCVLLLFLFFKARKLLYLLKLYLSYLLVTLASSYIIVTPQVVVTFAVIYIFHYIMKRFTILWDDCDQRNDLCCFLKKCIFVTIIYFLFVFIRACVIYVIINTSVDCIDLPAKPSLTAHRGCKDVSCRRFVKTVCLWLCAEFSRKFSCCI